LTLDWLRSSPPNANGFSLARKRANLPNIAAHVAGLGFRFPPHVAGELMEQNKTIIRQFVEECINQGNVESTGRFMTEDVVEQVPFPGQMPGIEGVKDVVRGMRAAFPDLHFTITEQLSEGDKVLSRFEWTGTHRGCFLGVPPTGRPIATPDNAAWTGNSKSTTRGAN
jgi:predicted ester cyclase